MFTSNELNQLSQIMNALGSTTLAGLDVSAHVHDSNGDLLGIIERDGTHQAETHPYDYVFKPDSPRGPTR